MPVALEHAIRRSQDHFLWTQHPEGYWWAELQSNVTITAEYLLLTHFLGNGNKKRWEQIVQYLKREQLPSGAWNIWYKGPPDLNATIEAYFAMKLAGVSPDEECMRKARAFILSKGGVPKARIFTKVWLALFGQWDWKGTPAMPPEIFLLPTWFPFNIYEFACWARQTLVAMLLVVTLKPTVPIPDYARIDELYPEGRARTKYAYGKQGKLLSWNGFFRVMDMYLKAWEKTPLKPFRKLAIRRATEWIVSHQEADGSWGGIQPPWVYSLIALKQLGYPLDHPVMKKGIEGFEGWMVYEDNGASVHVQPCVSPVWDTCLAMIALVDSGLPADHPKLRKAAHWLYGEQIFASGDWQVKNRKTPPGGWAFEFANDWYPDVDDTAEVLMALKKVEAPEQEVERKSLEAGLRWAVSMQSKNGGWGSFDKDNTKRFVTQIPFCDFGEVYDPPTEDVTAHIIEMLGQFGYDLTYKPARRGVDYLKRTQRPEGSWWGRWGVNYIYGTGAALPALKEIGEDMSAPYVRKAVEWLVVHQNADGGWGEDILSYGDSELAGRGESTASQTAWALVALLAAGEGDSDPVRRGVQWLIDRQQGDGQWEEPWFTGTGFPLDFMIKYHLYRNCWPLTALGRYRQHLATGVKQGAKEWGEGHD